MKVKISKENWIKATTDIKGKFWCPIERQESLLNVWPDGVDIEIEVDKPKTKKVKKYKYSRKDWLDYYEDLEHMHITKEAKEDLLAKESNEEYSQRIMMEQVPKKFSKKDYNKLNKALDNMAGHEPTGIFANKPVKGVLKEKHSTGKQEDNKDCNHKYTGNYLQDCDLIMHCEKCGNILLVNTHNPTPSPQEESKDIEFEEIEELNLTQIFLIDMSLTEIFKNSLFQINERLTRLIRNQNLIIKQLKQK